VLPTRKESSPTYIEFIPIVGWKHGPDGRIAPLTHPGFHVKQRLDPSHKPKERGHRGYWIRGGTVYSIDDYPVVVSGGNYFEFWGDLEEDAARGVELRIFGSTPARYLKQVRRISQIEMKVWSDRHKDA
jgi:hypothetical protein